MKKNKMPNNNNMIDKMKTEDREIKENNYNRIFYKLIKILDENNNNN